MTPRTKLLAPVASRRFCGICGRMVGPGSLTIRAPIAYCGAHSDVPALDALPPDPLESLPTMADESAAVLLSASPREDVPPANGSEPCQVLLLEVGAALALPLALYWLHFYLTEPPRVTGRDRRRGGYIKPPASRALSPGVTSTTGVTLTLVGGSSSSGEPGPASAGAAIRPKPRRPSSGTALGWSTAVTEDLGASGARLAAVASPSPVGELAVTGSAPSGVNDGRGDDRRDRLPVPGDVSITNLRGFVWPDGYTRYYQDGA